MAQYAGRREYITAIATEEEHGCKGIVVFDSSDDRHWLCATEGKLNPVEVTISLIKMKLSWNQHAGFRYQVRFTNHSDSSVGYSDPLPVPWKK